MSTVFTRFFKRSKILKRYEGHTMLPIELIEELRKEYGFSQQLLAETLSITQPAYSQMISRKQDINVSQAYAVANLFNVPVEKIISSDISNEQVECYALARRILQLPKESQDLIKTVLAFEEKRR